MSHDAGSQISEAVGPSTVECKTRLPLRYRVVWANLDATMFRVSACNDNFWVLGVRHRIEPRGRLPILPASLGAPTHYRTVPETRYRLRQGTTVRAG